MQRVRSVKASDEAWSRWEAAASAAGLSVNAWMRRAADEAAGLESALVREASVRLDAEQLVREYGDSLGPLDLRGKFKPDPRK